MRSCEGSFRALEAGALRFELLDELAEPRIDDTLQLVAELLRAPLGVDAAAKFADDEARLVADECRVDVLVGVADLGRRRPVHRPCGRTRWPRHMAHGHLA
jgi:hypothetical protein